MRENYFNPRLMAGKVAVVTGGATGIGLGIACALAATGADVVITSRSRERLEQAELVVAEQTGRLCAGVPCDVRDEDQVGALREFVRARFGPATVVVNNAAANFRVKAEKMTVRALRTVVETDLIGTSTVTTTFVGDMIEAGGGALLAITVAQAERGFPEFSHAGAAKAGITSLIGSWAREWGRYGIRANAIAPGPVPTPGVTEHMLGKPAEHSDDAFAQHLGSAPLGRLGRVEDVANAAVFLCSDAASWITGTTLTLDGGMNLPAVP